MVDEGVELGVVELLEPGEEAVEARRVRLTDLGADLLAQVVHVGPDVQLAAVGVDRPVGGVEAAHRDQRVRVAPDGANGVVEQLGHGHDDRAGVDPEVAEVEQAGAAAARFLPPPDA